MTHFVVLLLVLVIVYLIRVNYNKEKEIRIMTQHIDENMNEDYYVEEEQTIMIDQTCVLYGEDEKSCYYVVEIKPGMKGRLTMEEI